MFKKGREKTGGRGKGTPNKIPHKKELRELIKAYVEEHFNEVPEKRMELEGSAWLKAYSDFCKFILPTLQAVQMEGSGKITIEDKLTELSQDID